MIIIKDAEGRQREFMSLIAVFNYLSKKGWTLVPINMERTNTKPGDMYLFTKTVNSDEALKREFEK